MLCCYFRKKRHGSPRKSPKSQYKRNVYGMMLAKLDEFETLTPLMITPESISETEPKPSFYIVPSSSDSPPPPRRPNSGKTLIFPLNARRPPPVTLLGTPDSRLTSFENGTTKSCATIPEDDENVQSLSINEANDIDLISIDRTSVSFIESQTLKYHSRNGLPQPVITPDFELAVPTYGPPSPPAELSQPISLVRLPKNGVQRNHLSYQINTNDSSVTNMYVANKSRFRSHSSDSISSFSSPQESSLGTCSPNDTSGSISDSFYLACENDANSDSKNKQISSADIIQYRFIRESVDIRNEYFGNDFMTEMADQRILHRIDEEPEQTEECLGMATSQTLDSIPSAFSSYIDHIDSKHNLFVPKSISQQFELLNET